MKSVSTRTSRPPAMPPVTGSPTNALPSETAPPTGPGWVRTAVKWLLFTALCVAGWYFSPYWLPWVQSHLLHTQVEPVRPPARPVPVLTATAVQEPMHVYLNGLGTVTAFNTVTVRSRVEGELINVHFQEGQMVKQGDLLAEIDPRPYETQRDQAKGKMIQDEAALQLARVTLDRQTDLMKSNATTPQLVDQQVAVVKQAEALLQIDTAIYENVLLQLEYCRITAPISGRVGLRLVDRGNIVRVNDPNGLVVITQLEPIALLFTIPQDEIPRVQQRIKEAGELVVEAYGRDFQTRLATGKLSAIDNQVDAATGTLRLKAMFDNTDHTLFPNQFVNVRLLINTIENALVVPRAAVQRGPDFLFVYIVLPDGTVELRHVTTGPSEGNLTSITSGLNPGDVVVTDGLDKLQPGSKVVLPESSASEDDSVEKGEAAHAAGRTSPAHPVTGSSSAESSKSNA